MHISRIGTVFVGIALLSTMGLDVSAQKKPDRSQAVQRAYSDSDGRVHVVGGSGREVVLAKEKGQESVEAPIVAGDGRTVGWQVNFPNCCTSYPIPLTLVIYRNGRIRRRLGNGMGVFQWRFLKAGEQVAYITDTVHGNLAPKCTLVDVGTGRTLETWQRGDGDLPPWAAVFAGDVGPIDDTPH
jgi:hypothetical protein